MSRVSVSTTFLGMVPTVAVAAGVGVDAQQDIARQVGQDDAHLVLLGGGAQRGVEHSDIETVHRSVPPDWSAQNRLLRSQTAGDLFPTWNSDPSDRRTRAAGQSKGHQNQNDRGR